MRAASGADWVGTKLKNVNDKNEYNTIILVVAMSKYYNPISKTVTQRIYIYRRRDYYSASCFVCRCFQAKR